MITIRIESSSKLKFFGDFQFDMIFETKKVFNRSGKNKRF